MNENKTTQQNNEEESFYLDAEPVVTPPGTQHNKSNLKGITQKTEDKIISTYSYLKEAIQTGKFHELWAVSKVSSWVENCKHIFSSDSFNIFITKCIKTGHWAFLLSMPLIVIFHLVIGIKILSLFTFLKGIIYAVLIAIFQYTAANFLNRLDNVISENKTYLGSLIFTDVFAVVTFTCGTLIMLFWFALIKEYGAGCLIAGITIWLIALSLALIGLNPSLISVYPQENISGAEEAIGIAMFILKAYTRLIPIAFGIGAVAGMLALLLGILTASWYTGKIGLKLLGIMGLLPFIGYLTLIFADLVIQIIRGLISLGKKQN